MLKNLFIGVVAAMLVANALALGYRYLGPSPLPQVGDTFASYGGADPWCRNVRMRIVEIRGDHALIVLRSRFGTEEDRVDRLSNFGRIFDVDKTGCFDKMGKVNSL